MLKSLYIVGPTSSGKSDYAITIAKLFDSEVIGCDSRQIYRHMDIGTGKEPGAIQKRSNQSFVTRYPYVIDGIDHHMIDTHHPNTAFNAGKFVARASRIHNDMQRRSKLPIICGGTMFWAQALLEDRSLPAVPPDPTLRKQLNKISTKELATLLQSADMRRYQSIATDNALNNRPRLIRALEIIEKIGHVPPQDTVDYDGLNATNLIIVPSYSKKVLHERISRRLQKRLDEGMLAEVEKLHTKHRVPWSRLQSFGLEYLWCTRLLHGEISQTEFHEKLTHASYQYAKRQSTWLKRWQKDGANIHFVDDISKAKQAINSFL